MASRSDEKHKLKLAKRQKRGEARHSTQLMRIQRDRELAELNQRHSNERKNLWDTWQRKIKESRDKQ